MMSWIVPLVMLLQLQLLFICFHVLFMFEVVVVLLN